MEASAATRPTRPAPRVPARLLRLASDERLVEHVRGGSEAAFEAVFDRHHRGILAFCRHLLGSAEEAEDAVQHTFMAAYRSLIGSRQPIQLRAWLYTIARNRCLSVLRARRETPVHDLDELPTENLSAEVQRRQDLRDLLHDVGGLPEEQRSALVLAEVGGVSHDEIAQVLGVQREKVKALVFQARSSLIASRDARETPCDEIRVQLAELRGGALRRNSLRRHLKVCPGCRDFRVAVQDQRKMLALALPVAPTLLLKQGVMAGALGSGAAAAGERLRPGDSRARSEAGRCSPAVGRPSRPRCWRSPRSQGVARSASRRRCRTSRPRLRRPPRRAVAVAESTAGPRRGSPRKSSEEWAARLRPRSEATSRTRSAVRPSAAPSSARTAAKGWSSGPTERRSVSQSPSQKACRSPRSP